MNQQKGQIPIIFLVLVVIAIVLISNSSKFSKGIWQTFLPSNPTLQKETQKSDEKKYVPVVSENVVPVPDTIPPKRLNPQPTGKQVAETRKIIISLETDEKAVCKYTIVSGMSYDSIQNTFSNTNSTLHSTLITTLSEGEKYSYYIKCMDNNGNKNTDDFVIAFEVKKPDDFTPPVRSNQYPVNEVFSINETVMIGISTDEPAQCRYSDESGNLYSSMGKSLSSDGTGKYHTAIISGLQIDKDYNYFIRCKDLSDNVNTGDVMVSFRIE